MLPSYPQRLNRLEAGRIAYNPPMAHASVPAKRIRKRVNVVIMVAPLQVREMKTPCSRNKWRIGCNRYLQRVPSSGPTDEPQQLVASFRRLALCVAESTHTMHNRREEMATERKQIVVSESPQLWEKSTRRDFMRLMGIGGAILSAPSILASRSDNDDLTGPNTGDTVTIDFAKGDVAVLQFAYALEQLEADFYTRVAAAFASSGLSAAEQTVMADIKNHEVIHREFLKTALGTTNGFALTPVYPGVDFNNRTSVLNTAKTFEDLGVAAYNGAAQYLTTAANLTVAGKIVSVEARHAAAIRDLLAPKTAQFSPTAFDDAFSPQKVAGLAQGFIVDKLAFAGTIPTFVQGPNNNG